MTRKTEYIVRLEDNEWHYVAVPGYCHTCHPDAETETQRHYTRNCKLRQVPWKQHTA